MSAGIAPARGPAPPSVAAIPFLTARPLEDVRWLFLLLPAWWALGVDQFIPVLLLTWTCLRLFLRGAAVPRSGLLLLVSALAVVQVFSVVSIAETDRYLTFLRTLGTWIAAVLLVIVLTAEIRTWRDVRRVLGAAVAGLAVAATLSALAAAGLLRPRFLSPFGAILPEWIRATDYGTLVAERKLGSSTWFGGRWVFRTSSLFLFANTYAVALAAYLPMALLVGRARRRVPRALLLAAAALIALALASTTSRTAMAAAALGLAVALATAASRHVRWTGFVAAALLLASLVAIPSEAVRGGVDAVVGARGFGSANARLWIYGETLEGIARQPLLGFGTERDATGPNARPFPIGSHSTYLGLAYRHGLVALALLIAIYVRSWRTTRLLSRARTDLPGFRALARWSLTVVFVTAMATTHDLDATLMLYVWTLLAVLEASRRLARREERGAGPRGTLPAG